MRSRTGVGADAEEVRVADAIAVDTSVGGPWRFHLFEAKRSRADWLGERRRPWKAAGFARICECVWLVVPEPWTEVLLTLDELPEGWGCLGSAPAAGSGSPRSRRARSRARGRAWRRGGRGGGQRAAWRERSRSRDAAGKSPSRQLAIAPWATQSNSTWNCDGAESKKQVWLSHVPPSALVSWVLEGMRRSPYFAL